MINLKQAYILFIFERKKYVQTPSEETNIHHIGKTKADCQVVVLPII